MRLVAGVVQVAGDHEPVLLSALCCVLRAACYVLRATCCMLRAACYVLRAACCVLQDLQPLIEHLDAHLIFM